MNQAHRTRQKGVTLLEALIAVALLAMLASMLAPALRSAIRASTGVVNEARLQEERRIAKDALTQILSNAVILESNDARLFKGDNQSFRVASLAGGAIIRDFSFEVSGGRLIGEIRPLLDRNNAGDVVEILQTGAVGFSFYGRVSDDAPLAWSPRWDAPRPPLLVRFDYRSEDPERTIHSLEFGVHAREPLHCAFDTVSRRCRS